MIIGSNVRDEALYTWVRKYINYRHIKPIPGDASARRYFRVYENGTSFIAVDAPPEHENNEAFVNIARTFLSNGVRVPQIIEVNFEDGFLLLSDLGDVQLLKVLNTNNVQQHYSKAMIELINIQQCSTFDEWQLPLFDHGLLLMELNRFHEWYLSRHLGLALSDAEHKILADVYNLLIASAEEQPYVCVHRDYHSRNLMLLAHDELGILDFQDAVRGPITYDLVSLIRDCYVKWPPEQVYQWVEEFWLLLKKNDQNASVSLSDFTRWFDWMGLQRHLKVLGIFARLYRRDGKEIYLRDIPRILEYVFFVCDRYPEFNLLKEFLLKRVFPHESNDFSGRSWQPDEATHR